MLESYCIDCHDAESQKGGVDLAALKNLPDARAAMRLWWRAKDQVESGQMPPPKKDQPAAEQKQQLLAWIADNETFLRSGRVEDPGERRLRRLNRTEYATALQDLLGVPKALTKESPAQALCNIPLSSHPPQPFRRLWLSVPPAPRPDQPPLPLQRYRHIEEC